MVTMSTPRARWEFLNTILQSKEPGLYGELADSRTELVKIHDELPAVPVKKEMYTHLGTHIHTQKRIVKKERKIRIGTNIQVIGGNLKKPSMAEVKTAWATE